MTTPTDADPLTDESIRAWHAKPVMHGLQTVFVPDPKHCAICYLLDGKAAAERQRDEREAPHVTRYRIQEKDRLCAHIVNVEGALRASQDDNRTLRTSLTRAEADRDRYKALYHAERAALEAKFRAALPAQPKEGE